MKSPASLLLTAVVVALAQSGAHATPNTLTTEEERAGWRLLWDGKTSTGWRSARSDTFPAKGWLMQGGELYVLKSDGHEGGVGGDIVTTQKYANFELVVDFKITAGANSGIKYFVDPGLNKGPGSSIGLEFQILDDERHPDAKLGRNGNRTIGSVYDLYPAASTKKVHPIGEWNTARIVSRGAQVEHWLNGEKVAEYTRFIETFRQDVQASKYKTWPGFGEWTDGHILLQDHGDEVHFRNLKIRVLSPENHQK